MAGWLLTFANPYLDGVPDEERTRLLEDAQRRLAHLRNEKVLWFADYVRLRFEAVAR